MDREGEPSSGTDPVPSAVESLTASTESETFDSWTVVSEGAKKKKKNKKAALEVPVDEEVAEESAESNKHLEEEPESRSLEIIEKEDSNKRDNESTDDLSDGISIISDSESAGRISPHQFVGQVSDAPTNESEESAKEDASYDPLTPPTTPQKESETCTKVTSLAERSQETFKPSEESQQKEGEQLPQFFGLGVRGVFAVSLIIAVLAFIGRMNFWGSRTIEGDASALLQKLDEMELQNNLLRAEIDILNKQINFMKSKQPEIGQGDGKVPYKQDGKQYDKYEKKREKPKWGGAGDMYIETLEPYKKSSPAPPYDPEKEAKPIGSPPVSTASPPVQPPQYERKEYYERKPGKEEYQKYPDSNKYPPKDGKYDHKFDPKYDSKYQKHDNGKHYKNEDYKKDKYYKDDHEKYRKHDGKKDYHGGDGYHDKHDYKRKKDDWHEKMMHQREEMRRKQDKQNSNNWYIERGNGREEARVDSHEYRREGR